MAYSVLMSVYHKENPAYFRASVQSMLDQTVKTDNFVLVCDGPVPDEINQVIEWASEKMGEQMTVVRLSQNAGLGNALNEGIKHCTHELVARMDSDDISLPDRCEKQLDAFKKDDLLTLVSGIAEEFNENVDLVTARRVLPERHEDIIRFAKKRNPFNHPCVMFKKSAVERAGGYKEMFLLEDYYLWVRMLLNGAKGMNLNTPLIRMRTGAGMYKRRGGIRYVASQISLFTYMKENGMITSFEWLKSVLIRSLSGIAPEWLRRLMYMRFLRK